MAHSALVLMRFFPFDPSIDTLIGHRNLVLVYLVVWALHLAYAVYAVRQWTATTRQDAGTPDSHPRD